MILLVEDNPGDVVLFTEMLRGSGWSVEVDVAQDGEEALSKLRRAARDNACYEAMILDLNLPKIGGFEVLEQIRADAVCPAMMRLVLSSSALEADQSRARALGADEYFVKPSEFLAYDTLLQSIRTTIQAGRKPS
ncbi:MAG: response regulator [Pseudomonadota bacterium]|nr:response regulator [Pseudomonadota bacterium]